MTGRYPTTTVHLAPQCVAAHEISLPWVSAYLRQLRQRNDAFCRRMSCGRGSYNAALGAMIGCAHVDLGTALGLRQRQELAELLWQRYVCRESCRGGWQLCPTHFLWLMQLAGMTPSSLLRLLTGTFRMTMFFQVVEVQCHWHCYCLCSALACTFHTEQSPVPTPQTINSTQWQINASLEPIKYNNSTMTVQCYSTLTSYCLKYSQDTHN